MNTASGILSDFDINILFEQGMIKTKKPFVEDQIQPASLDLRLGYKAYRVQASFMPGKDKTVQEKLSSLKMHEIDIQNGAVLETGCVYIVELLERLSLPENISALTNPKSSTGRLDIFTRVISDGAQEFDKIPFQYDGPLYLEISPRTFPILVRTGSRLSQIRFRQGYSVYGSDLQTLHEEYQLVSDPQPNIGVNGLALTVDLCGNESGLIGYRGKRHTSVIDVDLIKNYSVADFWEPLYQHGQKNLILDPREFYILVSREAVHVPPHCAAEMTPFDPLVGEFRVHYAGFFDPGFGSCEAGGHGSKAVLEVRSHEIPFILEHGQMIGRLVYEKMLNRPKELYGLGGKSHYQAQGLKLSKHFV